MVTRSDGYEHAIHLHHTRCVFRLDQRTHMGGGAATTLGVGAELTYPRAAVRGVGPEDSECRAGLVRSRLAEGHSGSDTISVWSQAS